MLKPYLMEHPLFRWLDSRYLSFIADNASQIQFEKDEVILHQGEEAENFYVVVHGEVSIETEHPPGTITAVQVLGDGDVLGWTWLIPPYEWQFSARARSPSTALALNAVAIRTRCEEDHDFGYEMMKRFSSIMLQRLHAFRRASESDAAG